MQIFPVGINSVAENRQFVPQLQFQSGAYIFNCVDCQGQEILKKKQPNLSLSFSLSTHTYTYQHNNMICHKYYPVLCKCGL